MNIDKLFDDDAYLEQQTAFFTEKKHIRTIRDNPDLVRAHITKARHNLAFYKLNKQQNTFNDWLIIIL